MPPYFASDDFVLRAGRARHEVTPASERVENLDFDAVSTEWQDEGGGLRREEGNLAKGRNRISVESSQSEGEKSWASDLILATASPSCDPDVRRVLKKEKRKGRASPHHSPL